MLQLDEVTSHRGSGTFDWTFLGVVLALSGIGLINLSSALYSWGEAGGMHLFWQQLAWIVMGIFIMTLMSFWDYRLLEQWKRPLFVASMVLLVLVLFAGKVISGHRSWLAVGGFGIQPSELAKVATLIILAGYFADHPKPERFSLRDLWQPMLLVAVAAGLVAAEGDLGTSIYFFLMGFTLSLFAGIRWRSLLIMMVIVGIAAMGMYQFVLSPYQKQRIVEFANPKRDVKGHGYQVAQSKIAVGSGQMWGKGYRNGSVNKLKYLPEKHTDFVFPVLAEEWGFAGCSLVVLLYLALMRLAVHIGEGARDRFGSFLCVGVAIFLFWQVAINLGGVLGLMPMTGVTLPLLSYGGSSTLSVFMALGLVMSVSRRRNLF
jgi:rod shape determining protein RodA